MEAFHISASGSTPEINFNPDGSFRIKGISVSENTHSLFAAAFEWMEAYREKPAPNTTLEVFLTYFNTGTSKALLNLMHMLRELHQTKNVDIKVKWLYEHDDSDMSEAGEDYKEMVKIPFELVPVQV